MVDCRRRDGDERGVEEVENVGGSNMEAGGERVGGVDGLCSDFLPYGSGFRRSSKGFETRIQSGGWRSIDGDERGVEE